MNGNLLITVLKKLEEFSLLYGRKVIIGITLLLIIAALVFFLGYLFKFVEIQKCYEITSLVGKIFYSIILLVYIICAFNYTHNIITLSSAEHVDSSKIPTHLVLIITLLYLVPRILYLLPLVFFVAILKGISKINQYQKCENDLALSIVKSISKIPFFIVIVVFIICLVVYLIYKYKTKKAPETLYQTKLVNIINAIILSILYIFIYNSYETITDTAIVQPIKITGNIVSNSMGKDCIENNTVVLVFSIIWLIVFLLAYIIILFISSVAPFNLNPLITTYYNSVSGRIINIISISAEALVENSGSLTEEALTNEIASSRYRSSTI